jgi:CRP-like cAMP-binding protein
MTDLNLSALAPMVDKLARRSPLGPAETDALLNLPYRIARLDARAYLVREGDRVDSCVALLSGFACRSKIAGGGARQILSVHMRGDVLDLQNGLLDRVDHNAQALTRVEAAYIPIRAVLDAAEAHPAIARALWRDTVVDGSIFREWILNVGRRNARQRISHLICELALRQEECDVRQGPLYEWPLTQEHVADATGLTPVHVNRTLQGMRADGLIATTRDTITIVDWSALQAAGDFRRDYLHLPPAT